MRISHCCLAFVTFLLVSCGFTPRTEYYLPPELRVISLTSSGGLGSLIRTVTQELNKHGISTVAPAAGIANIAILKHSTSEDVLSVFYTRQRAETRLIERVEYRVTLPNGKSKVLTAVSNNHYIDDPLSALASAEKAEWLRGQLQEELVQNMIRQMEQMKILMRPTGEQSTPVAQSKTETQSKAVTQP